MLHQDMARQVFEDEMNEARELKEGGENNEKIKKTNNNKLRFAAWSV